MTSQIAAGTPEILILNPYLHPDIVVPASGDEKLVPGALLPAYQQQMRIGAGAYTGIAAALHGAAVGYLDWIGDDAFGEYTFAQIARLGHQTSQLRRYRGPHMMCLAVPQADLDDATMIASYPDQWRQPFAVQADAIAEIPTDAANTQAYFYSWYWSFSHPELAGTPRHELVAAVRSKSRRVLLDPNWKPAGKPPASDIDELIRALPSVDVLLPNARDAAAIIGNLGPRDTVRALLDLGPRSVVLTTGAGGVWWASESETTVYRLPVNALQVRDTVGAGDTFGGALATHSGSMAQAVARGAATASAALGGALASGEFDVVAIEEHAQRLLSTIEEIR